MKNFIQNTLKKLRILNKETKSGKNDPLPETTLPKPLEPEVMAPVEPRQPPKKRKKRKKGRKAPKPSGAPETIPHEQWHPSQFKVESREDKLRFQDFDLPDRLLHAISDLGFEYCTPIQGEILPSTMNERDAFGQAQTGTGKTAAFLITVITRLLNNPIQGTRKNGTPRILILAPTRELVLQVHEEASQLAKYCDLHIVAVFGGIDYEKQRKKLTSAPVDIIVATPGRLLDFQRRRDLNLSKVEVMIIDEADRMLDMGFIPDVRKIIHSTPPKDKRQTLMFSATLPKEVTRLAAQWTRDPAMVEIEPEQVAVDTVDQIVYIVTADKKFTLLFNILYQQKLTQVLVFCNQRHEVRRLAEDLNRLGINCSTLSGDVPQNKRIRRLEDFKAGRIRVMVATDVAGRGLHIEGMRHVINYKLPHDPEDYVHRIGRTGRAGAQGTSISFADEGDAFYIPAIEEFMGRELKCIEPEEDWLTMPDLPFKPPAKASPKPPAKKRRRRPRRRKPADGSLGNRRHE